MILCAIGIAFIIGMLFISLNCNLKKESQDFYQTLDQSQQQVYDSIISERKRIFIYSTIAGLIGGIVSVFVYRNYTKKPLAEFQACLFLAVAFTIQYFWYVLSPKQDLLVGKLEPGKQVEDWIDLYKSYQRTYHWGLLIGLVGYLLIGYGVHSLV